MTALAPNDGPAARSVLYVAEVDMESRTITVSGTPPARRPSVEDVAGPDFWSSLPAEVQQAWLQDMARKGQPGTARLMDTTAKEARLVTLRESWARVRPQASRKERAGLQARIRAEVRSTDRFYRSICGRPEPDPLVSIAGEEMREFDAEDAP